MAAFPLTLTLPADWVCLNAAEVAAHLAGLPLSPTSPWNVHQLVRDLDEAGGYYRNHLVAFDKGVLRHLNRDINRDRLPTFSYRGRTESFNSVSKGVRRKLLALEWVFGEPLGVVHLRLLERECNELFEYIIQLGVVVELQKNLRTVSKAKSAEHILKALLGPDADQEPLRHKHTTLRALSGVVEPTEAGSSKGALVNVKIPDLTIEDLYGDEGGEMEKVPEAKRPRFE